MPYLVLLLSLYLSAGSAYAKNGSTIVNGGIAQVDLGLVESSRKDGPEAERKRRLLLGLGKSSGASGEQAVAEAVPKSHDHKDDHDHDHGGTGGKSTIAFDPNEKKSPESGAAPKKDDGHGHTSAASPKAKPAPKKFPPKWEPMCFIVDHDVPQNDVNDRVQAVVSMFGACGVAVRPHIFAVDDMPRSPSKAAEMAAKVCPLQQKLGVDFAAAQAFVNWDDFSDEMCGSTPKQIGNPPKDDPEDTGEGKRGFSKRVGGCGQLQLRGGDLSPDEMKELVTRLNSGGEKHFGGMASSKGFAFSAVDKGQPGSTATHEFGHGHSMENYVQGKHGSGVKLQSINAKDGGGPGPDDAFNEDGCENLRAGANDNSVVQETFDKDIHDYYKKDQAPIHKMMAGKSFLGGEKLAVKPSAGGAPRQADPGQAVARTSSGTTPPVEYASRQDIPKSNPGPGGGHRKPGTSTGKPSGSQPVDVAKTPPPQSGTGGPKGYGYLKEGEKPISPSASSNTTFAKPEANKVVTVGRTRPNDPLASADPTRKPAGLPVISEGNSRGSLRSPR